MGTEVKMIVAALEQMSSDAMWAFIIYVVASKILSVALCWTGGIILASIVIKGSVRLVVNSYRPTVILKMIRNALQIGTGGMLYDSEVDEIEKALPEMITAYKNKK